MPFEAQLDPPKVGSLSLLWPCIPLILWLSNGFPLIFPEKKRGKTRGSLPNIFSTFADSGKTSLFNKRVNNSNAVQRISWMQSNIVGPLVKTLSALCMPFQEGLSPRSDNSKPFCQPSVVAGSRVDVSLFLEDTVDAPFILQVSQPQTMGIYRVSFVPYLQYLGHQPYPSLSCFD